MLGKKIKARWCTTVNNAAVPGTWVKQYLLDNGLSEYLF